MMGGISASPQNACPTRTWLQPGCKTDVIEVKMKMSSYGMRMDPKSIERSYKRQKDTQRHRPGRRPFNMKEEIGGMPPQVKECLEPPGAGRDKEVICLSPPWFWTSGLWNCVRIHFSSGKIIPETINIPSLLSLSVSSYFFLFLIRILIDKMVESKTMLCLIKKKMQKCEWWKLSEAQHEE